MDDMELDMFEKDGMESDFVLDTPDRLARMHQKSGVNRDHNSSLFLGSPARIRHQGIGSSRPSNEIVPLKKENKDRFVRRARLLSPICDSVDSSDIRPHVPRKRSEICNTSTGHVSTSDQIITSDNCKHGDVNAFGPASSSGISCPKMHSIDKRKLEKMTEGKNQHDSVMEVIEVLDSPEHQTIRKSIKDAPPKLPENKAVVEDADAAIRHLTLGPVLKHQRQQSLLGPLKLENRANTTAHRMLVHNEPSSYCKTVNCSTAKGGEVSAVSDSSHKIPGEITNICINLAGQNEPLNHDTTSRKSGQRKLVRNGCIAPSNIAKAKTVLDTQSDGKNKNVKNSRAPYSPAETEQETRPNSERHLNDKMKGKEISYGDDHFCRRKLKPESSSRRLPTEDGSSEVQPDISWFVEDPNLITTGNRKGGLGILRKKPAFPEVPKHIHDSLVADREHTNKINAIPTSDSYSTMPSFPLESTTFNAGQMSTNSAANYHSELDESLTLLKGKRKSRSAHNHIGDSSSDHFETLTSSVGQSSTMLPDGSRNSQRSGTSDVSVIDVEGICSPVRCRSPERITLSTPGDSHARALQVESDEQLARQLQEQLFNEDLAIGGAEIDASVAWALQQEENSQNLFMLQSQRHRSQTRSASAAYLHRQYSRNSLSNSSGRMPSNTQTSTRVTNLRRGLNRRNMDLDSRIDFLEAMEAAFDANIEERLPRRTNPLFHLQRDFNEDDYEMLLALDNDNDRHCGASLYQINNLPLSKVQSEDGELCAVCLETPTLGETIRHLPCLHRFHKNCIDPWLRRKTSCPVCKSGIT